MPQFKKDTAVIVGQAVLMSSLFVLLYLGKIDWLQLVAGIGLLQAPGLFGRSKEDEAAK